MIKPLGKNVVLEKEEEKKETVVKGIYLQDDSKNKSNIGKVIAISEELKKDNNTDIAINNEVLYRSYAGTEIEYDDHRLVVINIEDILGVIEK